jgi:hypothetical protein
MFVHCRSSGWIRSHRHHLVTGGPLRDLDADLDVQSVVFDPVDRLAEERHRVRALEAPLGQPGGQPIDRPRYEREHVVDRNSIGDHGHVQLGQLFEPGLDRRLLHKRLLSIDEEVEPLDQLPHLDGPPLEPGPVDGQPLPDGVRLGMEYRGDLVQRELQLAQPPDRDRLAGLAGRVVPVAGPSTTWAGLRRPSAS